MFHKFSMSRYQQTEDKIMECNIYDYKWTTQYDRYLTVMDALKAVIGCRQNSIIAKPSAYPGIKNAADYYKIWSFNGFNGLQKFRYYNDYTFSYGGAINNDPEGMYRLSIDFNDATIGKVYKGFKMYSRNIFYLNQFLANNYNNLDK
jgi:hypothetical protein